MPRIRLARTTAFRAALVYTIVFTLVSAAGLAVIYWATATHVQAQVDSRLQLETQLLIRQYQLQAVPALVETIRQRSTEEGGRVIFFYLLEGPGRERIAGQPRRWPEALADEFATVPLLEIFPESHSDDPVRVLATTLPGGYRLLVGRDLNEERSLLDKTLWVAGGVTMALFLTALAGSVWLGRQSIRRIDGVNRAAHQIMGGDMARRLPVTGQGNEFDALAREVNAMLDRIEQLMSSLRQVSDNVAHDLRSPLSRLRNRLEVTLLEARSEDEYRQVLEQTIADADELLKTFNALLSIAQAEAGVSREQAAEVDLAVLAEDMADLYGPVAEEGSLTFTCDIQPCPAVSGNRRLLSQALGNLLDNAIKYTPAGGSVCLSVGVVDGEPTLRVADSGPGIPDDQRERVLERFVRLDSARSTLGNGLGLSLVRAVAALHGARLVLSDNAPGLAVALHFPVPH